MLVAYFSRRLIRLRRSFMPSAVSFEVSPVFYERVFTSAKKYSPQRHRVRRDRENFLIKNSLLRVLRASAVQSPTPASQENLKPLI
jgi:hypothetical protein